MRQAVINSIKSSVLTAFYTPKFLVDAVTRQIHATFKDNCLQMSTFLEPSAGIGGFLPVSMPGTRSYAFEKDCLTGLILSLLYDEATTVTAGFETIATSIWSMRASMLSPRISRSAISGCSMRKCGRKAACTNSQPRPYTTTFCQGNGTVERGRTAGVRCAERNCRHAGQQVRARVPRQSCRPHNGLTATRYPFHADERHRGRERPFDIPKAQPQGDALVTGEDVFAGLQGKGRHGRNDDRLCEQNLYPPRPPLPRTVALR